jgi:hypothetical protein
MKNIKWLSFLIIIFIIAPFRSTLALNANIETIDGEISTIKDFSMEGKRHFYVDYKGGTSTLDWKDIDSFEIIRIDQHYWVEVLLLNGKKDSFTVRQFSSFRGKSDFGQWSIPFEKIRKVYFIGGTIGEKRRDDPSLKETGLLPPSTPKEMDKVTLKNGDILLGNISAEIISIRTNYGTLSFKKEDVSRVSFGTSGKAQKEKEWDTLYSKYGDKLTGTISASQIKITLLTGTDLSILRDHIKEVELGVAIDNEQKALQEKLTESLSKETKETK